MNLISDLQTEISSAISSIFSIEVPLDDITLQNTNPEFDGELTLVVFQLLKHVKGNPAKIGEQIGEHLKDQSTIVEDFNVVKGFLNLSISHAIWIHEFNQINNSYWNLPDNEQTVVLEYCGPNTNKPLHLGHVRNMLIGWSLAEILQKAGNTVHKVNIYNDRGIAICKSMVAWKLFGEGETPESTGMKGDHFVGLYYVKYAAVEAEQAQQYLDQGVEKREAVKQTEINQLAQKTLQKWEAGDQETLALWQEMNSWVYKGFNKTYDNIGVDFERDYLESNTYQLGKRIVTEGVENGVFYKKEDDSVWVDLEDVGLDQKLLLRGDGTSVYITQDIGTAQLRYDDYNMNRSIYVVGNEQDYHFQVLKQILLKLKKPFADGIQHLSYGMVDLPTGKMKSREGKVVDADDLIDEMLFTANEITEELGKVDGFSQAEKETLYKQVGLGALKFFILRVDPKKRMLFDPQESIDFQGFTGPFVQYTHARIQSVLKKANEEISATIPTTLTLQEQELNLIQQVLSYQEMLSAAATKLDHSIVAKYAFDTAKLFNQFYAHLPISKEEDEQLRIFRLQLSKRVGEAIKNSLSLLGIESPQRM